MDNENNSQFSPLHSSVPKGYKQTEVGVIPEDWEDTIVGQLVQNGVIQKPMDGNHVNIHPKSGDFVSFGIPFVMANKVRNGSVDLGNCSHIRKEQADSLQKGFSLSGDVLLTHKATIGNTAVVREIPFEYIMLTPQVTYYRVTDNTRLNNWYLRHYFDSTAFQKIMISLSGGGTRAYIGITAQHQLPIVVPPLPEQEAIAEALSDADALIESLTQLIAKKRQIKQGAMQELLTGKRRLHGFANSTIGYKQTEVGVIPKDWDCKTIDEVGFVTSGKRLPLGSVLTEQQTLRPYIRVTDMRLGTVSLSDIKFVPDEVYPVIKRYRIFRDDIFISVAGTLGIVGKIPQELDGANLTENADRITNITCSQDYLLHVKTICFMC